MSGDLTSRANIRRTRYSLPVPARTCSVSFTGPDGIRHSVNVQAETLYEAVALAVGSSPARRLPAPAPPAAEWKARRGVQP